MERIPDSDPHLRHLFDSHNDDKLFNVYDTAVINLSVGAPGPDLLQYCGNIMLKATKHRLDEENKEGKHYLYQYGITPGLWECREQLAKFLSRRYGDPVMRERLVLSCGATHGMQILLNTVVAPNGVIFVEEFTYMIALEAFRQFPLMKIVEVPMKDDVVDLDALEKLVEQEKKSDFALSETKIFWAMFYTMPTFHNPTASSLPPEKCQRLVKLARKHKLLVACDDVYNVLYYGEGCPPHRLFFYDNPEDSDFCGGNVVSNGTFSKILFPAVRLGWIECHDKVTKIIKESGIMKSGGAVNHYISGVIASVLELQLQDEFLDLIVETYKDRVKTICAIFDKNLPSTCSYLKPNGGYFIWIKLPKGMDGKEFNVWSQKNCKVVTIPGSRFSLSGKAKNFLRLSFSFHSAKTLENAATSLCEGLSRYISSLKLSELS